MTYDWPRKREANRKGESLQTTQGAFTVGVSRSTVSSWSAASSCKTWWFTKCAKNLANAVATTYEGRA